MASLFEQTYNPDVLSCIANLSNDEVFTPPELANEVLDLLPEEIWSNPNITFLDPASKSGVFLREIAKRLISGLEEQFPVLEERLEHIFKKQIYGMAVTELTSLLSRRSVYCSKYPTSKYSVVTFDNPEGNIDYKNLQHSWVGGKCKVCGASEKEYKRDESHEQYAYEFIHLSDPNEVWNMKFDVIVGNPPYQLSDSGHGASAMPIYQKFIEQAKNLNPRYLAMIIPARWYAGGRGLDDFRKTMLHDRHIRILHDYPNSQDCFPGVQIEGGVCYFLRERDTEGDCTVVTHETNMSPSATVRPLLEPGVDVFIRKDIQLSVFRKVSAKGEARFTDIVSPNDPFGFDVREQGSYRRVKPTYEMEPFSNSAQFYYFGWQKDGVGFVDRKFIRKNGEFVDKWKVLISRAYGMGSSIPTQVINTPFVAGPGSCCTETYLCIGPFESKYEAQNVESYIRTKFFRFLVMLIKSTQQAMKPVYAFVPMQDFSRAWTDEDLYKKYGLTAEEIDYIEATIKAMGDVDE